MDQQMIISLCPVAWHAQYNPNLVAIETDDHRVTFLELHNIIDSLTKQLIELNMKKGDRLVSIANNNWHLVLLQLTCLRNGFIFSPINPKFSKAEIKQRIALLNSTFIWQPEKEISLDLSFSPPSKHDTFNSAFEIDPLTVVSIIFTSGSTGTPKAVMHNYSNHYYSALGSQTVIPLSRGDKNLLSLPLFHISGYATVIRTIVAGATLKISNHKIDTANLKKDAITHLSLVTTQLQKLLLDDHFQSESLSIKHLLLGGSAFPTKILQRTRQKGFTYHLSYGSTEMASQIATSTNSEILQLLPHRKIKIINNEILLSGETRFVGYFKSAKQADLIANKQYFASSDLGQLIGKTVTITGRKDRQFISGGENIQPEEIEKVLLSYPGLTQICVLPILDVTYGQRPIAFIRWKNTEQSMQLATYSKDKLAPFKRPIHYFLMPDHQGLKPDYKLLLEIANKLLNKTCK